MSQTLALYSYEEIFNLKAHAVIPAGFDHEKFNLDFHERIELAKKNRRRSSHHFNSRPKVHRPKPKVATDDDGWSTVVIEGEDQAVEESGAAHVSEEESHDEAKGGKKAKGTVAKARPNNKNLGSSRAADAKDIQDVKKRAFNAFAALVSDEEE